MIHRPARLAVLISGSGSNLQAIMDACTAGDLQAEVVVIVSNKANAYGLERGEKARIATEILEKKKDQDRRAYDAALAQIVLAYQPDWVILAGWMRILTSAFLAVFPGRVINLHPALPSMFPGTKSIEQAYQAFQDGTIKETGVMVHLVPDELVDQGPVLNQEVVPIFPSDTLETLEMRMHQAEHRLLVRTLSEILQNSPSHTNWIGK